MVKPGEPAHLMSESLPIKEGRQSKNFGAFGKKAFVHLVALTA